MAKISKIRSLLARSGQCYSYKARNRTHSKPLRAMNVSVKGKDKHRLRDEPPITIL